MLEQKIIEELKKLSNAERLTIIEVALDMIRRDIQQSERVYNTEEKKQRMVKAAEILLTDYTTDDELIAFTSLDSEDFHV